MTSFAEMLGFDPASPQVKHATQLAVNDHNLIRSLAQARRDRGLSVEQVADAMGFGVSDIKEFEASDSDPHLSTIRRYAHAIGVMVDHAVTL